MNCNPNTVACQLALIRHSIDNPNVFQIWSLAVAIAAALGSLLVAVVATTVARKANETAEASRTVAATAAADTARRERFDFSNLIYTYLRDAATQWNGLTPEVPLGEQWLEIARRSAALANANRSGDALTASAKRIVDRVLASPKSDPLTFDDVDAVSVLVREEVLSGSEWVRDPEAWKAKYIPQIAADSAAALSSQGVAVPSRGAPHRSD